MDHSVWDSLISKLPDPHILQTWEWGQLKARYGWQPFFIVWPAGEDGYQMVGQNGSFPDPVLLYKAAALVLQRSLPAPGLGSRLRMLYVPKGPLVDWGNAALRLRVLEDLRRLASQQGAIFIKIDPDVPLGTGLPGGTEAQEDPLGLEVQADLARSGWNYSTSQVQFRNTVLIDLSYSEDELLARMKGKTRYNIRLAERRGVTVRIGTVADLDLLYRMYAETSLRDGFVIRDEGYYHSLWTAFMQAGLAEPLIAEVEGEPVAAVFVFWFARKAYYMYGMSRATHREKMPNHLLQWEAICRAKAAGCRIYDLWGAPETFDENDPMWGVYRFKEGLGGTVLRTLGAWDLPLNPLLYRLFTQAVPRILDVLRNRGKSKTREAIGTNFIAPRQPRPTILCTGE